MISTTFTSFLSDKCSKCYGYFYGCHPYIECDITDFFVLLISAILTYEILNGSLVHLFAWLFCCLISVCTIKIYKIYVDTNC